MKIYRLLTLFLILTVYRVTAQHPPKITVDEMDDYFKEMYGPDQALINGIQFYNQYLNCAGHQYFGENKFRNGKLVIENTEFHNAPIKYNLFEQHIIVSHLGREQVYLEIILSNSRIREFELDGKVFRKLSLPGRDTLFYQVLEEEDLAVYHHWTKILIPSSSVEYSQGKFSGMLRESYLLKDSMFHSFKGAKSFSRIFPEHQSRIRRYIRKNRI